MCNGQTGSIALNATGGTTPYTYSGLNPATSGLSAGSYTYNLTDANGCPASAMAVITVPSAIIITSAVKTLYNGSDLSCSNSSNGVITATANGGTGTLTYSKDNGINYQASNVFSGLGAGSYSIVVRDANFCISSASTVTITAPAPVQVSATPTVLCGAASASVLVSATGGTGSYTYSMNGINYLPTATFTGLGSGAYTFYGKDDNGCIAPASAIITLLPLPVPVITGLAAVCEGTANVTYSTATGMTNYAWMVSAGGGITSGGQGTDNTVTVTWNAAGPQTVSVNYISGNGCTAASATVKDVTVNPAPVPVISGSASTCILGTCVYTTETGMTDYSWTVTGGTFTGGSTNTINVSWNTAGAQTVTVTYKNTSGCPASAPTVKNVTVNLLPTVVAGTYGPVCADAADILLSGSPAGGVWSGTGVTGNSFDPSAGTHTLTYTYTSDFSCTSSAQTTIIVYPSVAAGITIVASENPAAAGSPVTFTATTVNPGATVSYQWKVNSFNVGTNSPVFTYAPVNTDNVVCVISSTSPCVPLTIATSNAVVMEVTGVTGDITVTGTVSGNEVKCYSATNKITVAGNGTTFIVDLTGSVTMVAGHNILYLPGTKVNLGAYMKGSIGTNYCGPPAPSMVSTATGNDELPEISRKSYVKLYPNPSTGKFTLEFSGKKLSGNERVDIYGMTGERLYTSGLSEEMKYEFSLPNLQHGVYFVRITSEDAMETVKLVITK